MLTAKNVTFQDSSGYRLGSAHAVTVHKKLITRPSYMHLHFLWDCECTVVNAKGTETHKRKAGNKFRLRAVLSKIKCSSLISYRLVITLLSRSVFLHMIVTQANINIKR